LAKLKIILQYDRVFYLLLVLALMWAFIRINVIKYHSRIIPSSSFEGIVTNIKYSDNSYKITVKNKEEVICYYNSKNKLDISFGDKIKIVGDFYEPSNNTIPNTFNYKKYLNHNRIFYLFSAKEIILLEENSRLDYKIKNFIIKRIDKSLDKTKGYVKAFIIGDKTDLEEYQTYQANGVSHLFALSGMHISLLTMVLYFFLKKFKYQNIFIIIFLLLYLMIANNSASLLRSVIFFILFKINKRFNLDISTKNVLIITVVLLILINPLIIFDYGFLYSVIVTFGLIISSKYFRKNYLFNLFLTSLVAFLFSLPITLSTNYEINLLSIVNNLFIVPLISLIIYPLSLLTFIIPFLEPLLCFILSILEKINGILNILAIKLVVPKVSIIFYLIYYVFLILFIKSNNYKYLIISLILILSLKLKPYLNNSINIYFLDVRQGDSVLIIDKNKVLLIDTGGIKNKTVSDNTIKMLKSLGYSQINTMIITHGDFDHMGEAITIVNNFTVEKVIFNCGPYNDLESELIKVLDKKKIKYYSCIKELNIDKNKLYFLQTKEYDNENDNSNVIYTELDGYKFMFMGDASSSTEKEILNKYNLPDIDILKVGHHGSKTSSSEEFIDEIKPKYSIISVGKKNCYGHPNKEVLNNLEDSKIYRTDQDGSIMFGIKNNKLKIETCGP